MTATERVAKFKERQKALGRKPFYAWLSPEAIRELRKRAKGKTGGEVIEALLAGPVAPGMVLRAKTDTLTPDLREQIKAALG